MILIILFSVNVFAWNGKCVGVSDGDTITVMHAGKGEKIRLHGVDCPEKNQSYGQKAKLFTSVMVFGKQVEVEPVVTDKYGRTVGKVTLDGKILNEELVKAGYAWVYNEYCNQSFCDIWRQYQEQAKSRRIGLWDDIIPIPPWDFRHHRGTQSTYLTSPSVSNDKKEVKSFENIQSYDTKPVKETYSTQQSSENIQSENFRGNIKSKVFHRSSCQYFDCDNCTAIFRSKDQAIGAGFRPCKKCNP